MLKKVPIMPRMPRQKVYCWRWPGLVWVLCYTLLGFDSLQFSVDCPTDKIIPRHYATINCMVLQD